MLLPSVVFIIVIIFILFEAINILLVIVFIVIINSIDTSIIKKNAQVNLLITAAIY